MIARTFAAAAAISMAISASALGQDASKPKPPAAPATAPAPSVREDDQASPGDLFTATPASGKSAQEADKSQDDKPAGTTPKAPPSGLDTPAAARSSSPAASPAKPGASVSAKHSAKPAAKKAAAKTPAKKSRGLIEYATFAAGCFWSTEAVFERVPGVKSVVSGFSGGNVAYPSYQLVCTGTTGHAESVHIAFDPDIVTYEQLVRLFFEEHDPTTLNAQGDDYGTQYRSAIFYHGEEQKETAEKVYKDFTKRRIYSAPIVTQLVKFTQFYPAEEYHQDYYQNHELDPYSQVYILPKLYKLRKKLKLN